MAENLVLFEPILERMNDFGEQDSKVPIWTNWVAKRPFLSLIGLVCIIALPFVYGGSVKDVAAVKILGIILLCLAPVLAIFVAIKLSSVCQRCNKNKSRKDIPYCNSCLRNAVVETESIYQKTLIKIEKMSKLGLREQIKGAVKKFEESLPDPMKTWLEAQKETQRKILTSQQIKLIQKKFPNIRIREFDPSGFRKYPLNTPDTSTNLSLEALEILENLVKGGKHD